MNELFTSCWCNEILGSFSFSGWLLEWDSFEAHSTDDVKKLLKLFKTETVVASSGWTKYIQAPELVWNRPFKGRIQELHDEWLASGKYEYTATGNMKPVLRRFVVEWVLTS